jgi:hypothetical protein
MDLYDRIEGWIIGRGSVRDERRQYYAKLIEKNADLASDGAMNDYGSILIKNDRLSLLLYTGQFVLLCMLLVNLFKVPVEVTIYDVKIGPTLPIREVLLLMTTAVGAYIYALSETNLDVSDILAQAARARFGDGATLYLARHRRLFQLWAARFEGTGRFKNNLQVVFAGIAIVSMLAAIGALLLLSLSVQFLVIWKMWHEPAIPMFFNRLIIAIPVIFDIVWLSAFLMDRLPRVASHVR